MMMPKPGLVRGSREDLLENIYLRLESSYEFEGKAEHLNCLQEIMAMFSTLSKKNTIMLFPENNGFDFKSWYENNE